MLQYRSVFWHRLRGWYIVSTISQHHRATIFRAWSPKMIAICPSATRIWLLYIWYSQSSADGGVTFPRKIGTIFNSRHGITSPRTQSLTYETSRQGKWQIGFRFFVSKFKEPWLSFFSIPCCKATFYRALLILEASLPRGLPHSCWHYAAPKRMSV